MPKNLRINFIPWTLGLVAGLASCSGNEIPETPEVNTPRTTTVTFNAVLDNDNGSRAASKSDENANISRYVLEVYVDGSTTKDEELSDSSPTGSFQVTIDVEKSYDMYCWADEGDASSYDLSNGLGNISLKPGHNPTIAHLGTYSVKPTVIEKPIVGLPMHHVVAKVALQTTSALAANSARADAITYSGYNAIKQQVTGTASVLTGPIGPAVAITDASQASPVDVAEFYTLVSNETCTMTINYTTEAGIFSDPYTTTKSNVPVSADHMTVLRGDIAGMQYSTVSITANLDDTWTSNGDDISVGGNGGGTTEEPTVPEDPANPYTVITIDGKDVATIKADIAAAVASGNTSIRLTGQVFDGLFGFGSPFSYQSEYKNIDISQTTGWDAINNTLPNLTFGMINAEKIYIPAEIEIIGEQAFSKSNITAITLPGATNLEQGCFQDCYNLTEINAPKATTIKGSAFANCSQLTTLKLTAGNINLDTDAFGPGSTSSIDLWLNVSEKSNITSPKSWKTRPWRSITLVNDDGSISETI